MAVQPKVVFSVTIPLEGEADFAFKWTLPAGSVERGLLLSKAGAVIAGLVSGNLNASVYHSLREKGCEEAEVLIGRLNFYQQVLAAMKRTADPVVCPTRAFQQQHEDYDE